MYRLILPVVDVACAASGLEPFFEFSQPNGPNRRLSADIALMQGETPIWLIEAKRFTQKLHPDLIAPYLKAGVMGVVTNGNHWVFSVEGKTLSLGPLLTRNWYVDAQNQEKIVGLLSIENEAAVLNQTYPWSEIWKPLEKLARPEVWHLNRGKGTREFVEKTKFLNLRDALLAAQKHVRFDSEIGIFIEELLKSGQDIATGWLDVSSKRLVWWLPDRRRGARLNLEGRQVEMLALNRLIEIVGRDCILATVKLHDKNHAMSTCKAKTLAEMRSLIPIFGATDTNV